jgi:hypothetical protein
MFLTGIITGVVYWAIAGRGASGPGMEARPPASPPPA